MTNFVITLKWVLLVITLTRVNADDTHGIEKRDTNNNGGRKIVCYYTNWSVYRPGTAKFTPQNINPYLCTHLIYAFGGLDKENGLRPYDKYQDIEQGGYAKFTGLKTHNKNLKTMLAIGGWNEGSSRFSNLVADEDRRAAFVKNVVKFLRVNNFDGLDLDWEYPAFRDGSKPADKENYASLVKELREEFEKEASKTLKPRLLLTMAVPAGIEYIDKGYDIPKLNKYLDFMNILSYDYHSAYEPNVNHHSPLYSLQEESEYNFDAQLTIDYTIKHYLKKGADPEKLVLGIPTYGRSYSLFNVESTDLGSPADGPGEQGEATREKGYLAYYEICANVENPEWKIIQPRKSAMGPYAYKGNQWVGYDDVDIVKLKAKYVNEKNLGGIMYWSIDNDDFRGKCHGKPYPLIEAGKEALLSANGNSDNAISATTEEKRNKLINRKNRPKHHSTTSKPQTTTVSKSTTPSTTFNPLSTPEPPTTPDPGTDFVCKEEGFFPHPRDCKKYFWCLDSGPSNLGIVAHQFTCPSGLMFNKATDSCDYSRNVICSKKSEKTSSSTTPASKSTTTSSSQRTTSSTTTTTTTTPEPPVEEDYEDEVADKESEEDPKSIKQLISLIQELGGIDELKKQLNIKEGSKEAATTPAISKNLYNKVFSSPSNGRFRNQHRNAPSGPQNEGLPPAEDLPYKKDKPQYVTIQRSRPLKNIPQDAEDSGTTNNKAIEPNRGSVDYVNTAEEDDATTVRYSSLSRSRTTPENRSSSPKYVVLERNRHDRTTTTEAEENESPASSTSRYITLVRNRPSTTQNEVEEPVTETTERTRLTTIRTTESSFEKTRDKVSESETTTPLSTSTQAQPESPTPVTTLTPIPVTSAQNETVTTVTPGNTNWVVESTTTNSSNTFIVYAQTVPEADYKHTYDKVGSATDYRDPTEPYTTATATTVFTTISESATEITRIPFKMYREFVKKNRTHEQHQDLATNLVSDSKQKDTPSTPKSKPKTSTRQPFYRGRKLGNTTSSTTEIPASSTQSRFSRRKSTSRPHESQTVTDSSEETRANRIRGSSTESGFESNFKRRRGSTTSEKHEISSTTLHPRGTSRYSNRGRKASDTTPTEDGSTTQRSRFLKDHNVRVSDQLSESDSYEQEVTDNEWRKPERNATDDSGTTHNLSTTRKPSGADYLKHKIHSNHSTSETSDKNTAEETQGTTHKIPLADHFRHWAKTTPNSTIENSTRRSLGDILRHRDSSVATHSTLKPPSELLKHKPSTEPSTHKFQPDIHFKYKTTSAESSETQTEAHKPFREHFKHKTTSFESIEDESRTLFTASSEPSSRSYSNHFRARTSPLDTSSSTKPVSVFSSFQPIRVDEFFHKTSHLPVATFEATTPSRLESSPVSETYSRVNPRNNSRFLKNPEFEYKQQQQQETRVSSNTKSNSPVFLIQKAKENQIGFEVQINHGAKSSRVDLNKALASQRSRTKFSKSRASEEQMFDDDDDDGSDAKLNSSPQHTTYNPRIRNRGTIKARDSLSKAEIKELANLVQSPSRQKSVINHPINRIEEAPFDASTTARIRSGFTPRHRFEETISNTGSSDYSRIYTLPNDADERLDDEVTEEYIYVNDESPNGFGFVRAPSDVFRVSETKYANEGARHVYTVGERVAEKASKSAEAGSEEPSSRVRGNFRRNNQSRSRSTLTAANTPSTSPSPTVEYSAGNSNNLNSRFRRRKGRPENRSINTVRSEPFIPPSEIETSTVTRHKNYDISHRGSAIVSDYLPVPESLYRVNQTSIDHLNADNLNLQDIEAQTLSSQNNNYNNNYNLDDVSDLANPAVAAITNLKTIPPIPPQPQIIYAKAITAAPQIPYTSEPQYQFFSTKATPVTIRTTDAPIYQTRISHRRGNSKSSSRHTTTTLAPSLQDIYNDYQESDVEYHAEPVEIPVTGKVRIHSDGYIECLDMGNFPHPFSCRKFISCAKMDFDSLLGWEYTCPKGLSFDPIGGICNWAAGLGCKD